MLAAEEEEREPTLEAPKYMAKLQTVANLQLTQITIELDDLLAVQNFLQSSPSSANQSTNSPGSLMNPMTAWWNASWATRRDTSASSASSWTV